MTTAIRLQITESVEAAKIAEQAADHIARVGRTNDIWDLEQEAAGTPRNECRVNVIGALRVAAHGDPDSRLSSQDGAANEARETLFWVLDTRAFLDSMTPTTADAVNVLRKTASHLQSRAEKYREATAAPRVMADEKSVQS